MDKLSCKLSLIVLAAELRAAGECASIAEIVEAFRVSYGEMLTVLEKHLAGQHAHQAAIAVATLRQAVEEWPK